MLRLWKILAGVIAAVIMLAGCCSAAEVSADLLLLMPGKMLKGKIYIKGKKIRAEFNGPKGGMIVLGENNSKTRIFIDRGRKIYHEVTNKRPDDVDDSYLITVADKKVVGENTINGYKCTKIRYTFRDNPKNTDIRWVSDKFKVPVRMEQTRNGVTEITEYKNVKECKLPDSLFQIPKGYKKAKK